MNTSSNDNTKPANLSILYEGRRAALKDFFFVDRRDRRAINVVGGKKGVREPFHPKNVCNVYFSPTVNGILTANRQRNYMEWLFQVQVTMWLVSPDTKMSGDLKSRYILLQTIKHNNKSNREKFNTFCINGANFCTCKNLQLQKVEPHKALQCHIIAFAAAPIDIFLQQQKY